MNISDNTRTNRSSYDIGSIEVNCSNSCSSTDSIGYSKTSDVYILGIESLDINSANGCICTNLTGDNTSSDLGIQDISSIEVCGAIDVDISPLTIGSTKIESVITDRSELEVRLPCLSRLIVEEGLVGGSLKNDTAIIGCGIGSRSS